MCEPNCKHALGCTEVDGECYEGGNGCFSEAEATAPPPVSPSKSSDLLARLDRVGVHQSVAARYCKEAAAEIRHMREALELIADYSGDDPYEMQVKAALTLHAAR